ncbi:DUF2325 domain-containing protein [Bacillus solimangrovi]|uniref:Dihydroorotate dehydrogenase n=1 Tax=Bacillus solimangrovi TaxID=1305675 RepID=A0A1E5LC03_9BACI|nr:DUF2325 domain-containing protein [Bacillus solimangrovi]OEH91529.1 dihydroorotate dehydrogenase [Bacillus solimangrovi]
MENILIIGADRLGKIEKNLLEYGFSNVTHIDGRKVKMVHRKIPEQVDIILILTDFINHNLANTIKNKAKQNNIPTLYARRSWCSIAKSLETVS